VRFTGDNIDGDVEVESVTLESPSVQRLLCADAQAQIASILSQNGASLGLYHITFTVASSKAASGVRTLLGESFYADGDFGPYTEDIHHTRDLFLTNPSVVVHFFTLGMEWLYENIAMLNVSIQQQRSQNPLYQWWPNKRINPQLGMQLPVGQRPTYKIPARFQFDSPLEYFTIQFYTAVASFEAVENISPVPTVVRLVAFPGGADRVYYAAIQMVHGLPLRTDSIIDVSFAGEDTTGDASWKGVVINSTPFSSGYDYSAFLFRPRVGREFASDPVFNEYLLDSTSFDTLGDLSEALVHAPGIQCEVVECVPKVGLS
jgi:hypothetical protein